MNFPLWYILFLLQILVVFVPHRLLIYVVHVGVFLDIGVEIYEGRWGHNFSLRGQRFFADHSSSIFWCHSKGNQSNQHPHGNIFRWIILDDLHVVFQYILLQNHQQPTKMRPAAIFDSREQPCVCIGSIHVEIGSLLDNHLLLFRPVVGRTWLYLSHCVISPLVHIVL